MKKLPSIPFLHEVDLLLALDAALAKQKASPQPHRQSGAARIQRAAAKRRNQARSRRHG